MPIPNPTDDLKSTLVIQSPSDSQDDDGGPLVNTPGSVVSYPITVQARMHRVGSGGGTRAETGTAPHGETMWECYSLDDPGIVAAQQEVNQTANEDGAISPPTVFRTHGPARIPYDDMPYYGWSMTNSA